VSTPPPQRPWSGPPAILKNVHHSRIRMGLPPRYREDCPGLVDNTGNPTPVQCRQGRAAPTTGIGFTRDHRCPALVRGQDTVGAKRRMAHNGGKSVSAGAGAPEACAHVLLPFDLMCLVSLESVRAHSTSETGFPSMEAAQVVESVI
jgi:hypothetical protein